MLSTAQKEQFQKEGYLVIESLVDEASLSAVKDEYRSVFARIFNDWHREGLVKQSGEGLDFWQMLDIACASDLEWFQPLDISLPHDGITEDTPFHFGPAVFDLITDERVLDVAQDLLGPEITSCPIQHVRIKPPQNRVPESEVRAHVRETSWHQDRGVTLEEADRTEMVTVWIAVTDANRENGCLQVIPNPPAEMYPHCPKSQTTMADAFVEAERAIHTEVKAGGAVIIHPLTPHSAGPNESEGYRWSFDIRFSASGQPTGRSQFPEFIARSARAPQSELHDWKAWKQSWEAARTHLSNSEHIPQHRWDGSSPLCA
ncbi:MAG: phytanoyl-CoA dioxygenase family protein [Hyphomicrobiales bacterium]|nr:phytanoyl-CoA dioxygenase family protein [Hyphomicrobiales bacterium]